MYTDELVQTLDKLLNVHEIEDASLNGLQVANSGSVHKVALAVDVSVASIQKAKDYEADFLIVHHGLFWGKPSPIVGSTYQRIKLLIESNIALYAIHIPLDVHPELGNNAQIINTLGWPISGDFGKEGNL